MSQKALWFDDNKGFVDVAAQMLRDCGYEVDVVSNWTQHAKLLIPNTEPVHTMFCWWTIC